MATGDLLDALLRKACPGDADLLERYFQLRIGGADDDEARRRLGSPTRGPLEIAGILGEQVEDMLRANRDHQGRELTAEQAALLRSVAARWRTGLEEDGTSAEPPPPPPSYTLPPGQPPGLPPGLTSTQRTLVMGPADSQRTLIMGPGTAAQPAPVSTPGAPSGGEHGWPLPTAAEAAVGAPALVTTPRRSSRPWGHPQTPAGHLRRWPEALPRRASGMRVRAPLPAAATPSWQSLRPTTSELDCEMW